MKILLILSNVCPNKKSPGVAIELAKKFDAELYVTYIVDKKEHFDVDTPDQKVDKLESQTVKQLKEAGQSLLDEVEKKYEDTNIHQHFTSRKGDFIPEILKKTDQIDPDLIIVGREQKEGKLLGVFKKGVKSELVKKSTLPILFVK